MPSLFTHLFQHADATLVIGLCMTSVSSAVQSPQGPPGRIPPVPETVLSRSGSQWTRGALHQDKRHHTSSITVVATSGAGPVLRGRRHSKAPGSRAHPLGPGAPVAHVLVASPYLRGWGRRARTHPRPPSHRPPRSREHKAFHDQPCSYLQAGGGPPRLPSRGRPAPPQTARGPTPSRTPAHSLSPAPGINMATGPRPWGSPAVSNGLRQARSGLRWCSGHPHGSPLSLPVNLPRGVAQDNRRSLGPSGADGSSLRHLRLRGHAPSSGGLRGWKWTSEAPWRQRLQASLRTGSLGPT
ncbi:hypothetical protein NDU88_004634 [Pleurodeles waltl]|uniref:Uncharacterized protein n=1 Tax=Pleurodeles waltl TaxID=8319 RepID=A0AAV7WSF6_PLEWA|nr:hypothetical protein NDU88_004634 [Pleurodeles waltl]